MEPSGGGPNRWLVCTCVTELCSCGGKLQQSPGGRQRRQRNPNPIYRAIVGLAGPHGPACRSFYIPSPAPPKLIGALLVLATTVGFLVTDWLLASGLPMLFAIHAVGSGRKVCPRSGSALARDSANADRPLSADTVEKLSRSLLREGRPTTDSVVLTESPQSIDGLSASAEFFNSIGQLLPLWSARRKVGIRGRSRRRRDRPTSVRFRGRTWCLSWRKTADRKAWRRPTGRARVRRTLECA
jgi:XapX domain-containing protein